MELNFKAGDTVRVHTKIKEGDRERVQIFEGMVLSIRGRGENKTFTVRRVGAGSVGIERIWPVESSSIVKVDVKSRGEFRRSKVYFVRGLSSRELALASAVKKS